MPLRDLIRSLPRVDGARQWAWLNLLGLAGLALSTAGCSSLLDEGSATGAGVAGTAIAATVTNNPAVAAGIGLGVLAGAQAGVKAVERRYHGNQQDHIAEIAGALNTGQVAPWESFHSIQIEPNEKGRVTVSRVISATDLTCKEIVFSVDHTKGADTLSAFYVATICKDAVKWRWATAEPATTRWGSLQ